MSKKTTIEMWMKETGKKREELEKTYEEIYKEASQKYSGIQLENIAIQEFGKAMRKLKWGSSRPVVEFLGFIYGVSGTVDYNDVRRKQILKKVREIGDVQAQLEGLIDESGTPLDTRETIFGNKNNPNYHKPLMGHAYFRIVYGLAKKVENTKETSKVFILRLRQKAAKNFNYKPFLTLRFKAIIKDESKGFYDLNLSKQTQFLVTKAETIDFEKWIRDTGDVKHLDDLRRIHAATKNAPDYWTFVECFVDKINLEVNVTTRSRSITLSDPERTPETIRCFIDEEFPINFQEYSKVIVLGRTRTWKRPDDVEERYSMNIFGIYPLPGQLIEMDEEELNIGFEEDEEEGFIVPFIEEETEDKVQDISEKGGLHSAIEEEKKEDTVLDIEEDEDEE